MPWIALRSALARGRAALSRDGLNVVVVDEVGPWELAGSGWARELNALVESAGRVLLVLRDESLPGVLARWGLDAAQVLDVAKAGSHEIAEALGPEATRRA